MDISQNILDTIEFEYLMNDIRVGDIKNLIKYNSFIINEKNIDFIPSSISLLPISNIDITIIESKNIPDFPQLNNIRSVRIYPEFKQYKTPSFWAVDKLKNLFDQLINMTNLEKLEIKSIEPDIIPDNIGNLTNLKYLNIAENRLYDIPETIQYLTNLRQFILNHNYLTNLLYINNLFKLELLDISSNNLKFLNGIHKLTNLKTFIANSNSISEIPDEICNLHNLEILNLSNNRLLTLPENIGKLKSLKELYLARNQIKKLPDSIEDLKNLEIIDISYNNLIEIPDTIKKLPRIKKIYTKNNISNVITSTI